MKPSTGCPFLKANTAGIDCTPSCAGMSGYSSVFIFTRRTAPREAFTTFSRMGVSCLHGPHHGAQKSTITGTFREASMTLATNDLVVVSLIRSPEASGFLAAPPPKSEMAISESSG